MRNNFHLGFFVFDLNLCELVGVRGAGRRPKVSIPAQESITFQRYLLSHLIIEDTQERAPLMLAEFNVNCMLTIIYTGQTHAQVVPSLWVSTYRQMLFVSIPLIETDSVTFRDRTARAYNH